MINTNNFLSSYQSFWVKTTPWLISFIASLNKSGIERVFKPLDESEEARFRSINNETAFIVFENPSLDINDALLKCFDRLKFLPRNSIDEYILDDKNKTIITKLSDRMSLLYKTKKPKFNPLINGFGAINSCYCDFIFNNTLCEIKSGDRKFNSTDFKQIMLYLALNNSSKQYNLEYIELFNPRTGFLINMKVSDLIESISDFSPDEVFKQIINIPDNVDIYQ